MTDIFKIGFEADTKGLNDADKSLDEVAVSADKADKEVQGLNKSLGNTSKAAGKAAKGAKKLGAETAKTGGAFKLQKNASQQLGFQLQDMAVQAQMGISPFTILGQQGSQLAGVFGAGGALFGAVIAIGAALGGVLWNALKKVGDSSEDLMERIDGVADSFDKLGAAQKKFLASEEGKKIAERKEEFAELQKEAAKYGRVIGEVARLEKHLATITGDSASANRRKSRTKGQISAAKKEAIEATKSLISLNAQIETVQQEIDSYSDKQDKLTGTTKTLTEAQDKNRKSLDSTIKSLQFRADTIDLTARETAIFVAVNKDATQSDLDSINASFSVIESYDKRIESSKKLQDELEKESKFKLKLFEDAQKEQSIEEKRQQSLIDIRVRAFEKEIELAINNDSTALEIESARFENSISLLSSFADEKGLIQSEIRGLEIALETEHQSILTEIAKSATQDRLDELQATAANINNVVSIFGNLTSAASEKRKRQLDDDLRNSQNFTAAEIANKERMAEGIFKVQQKADLAAIVSNTGVGITGQLAQGNWGGAAAVLAVGIEQHAKVSANSYQSPASMSGGGISEPPPSVNNTTNNSGNNIINFTVQGGDSDAIEQIRQAIKDGEILFDQNTEQAGVLR